MDAPEILVKTAGLLAREWFGDPRFRDVVLHVEEDEQVLRRVPLHDAFTQPLVAGACRGNFDGLAGDIVRGIYDRNSDQSFVLVSELEDDFAQGLTFLERVPGIEAQVAALRREWHERRKADPRPLAKRLPLLGSFGAKAIHDLLLRGIIAKGEAT